MDSTLTSTNSGHSSHNNRISCLTVGPNQIFVGTVGGDIQVIDKNSGEVLERNWRQDNTPIEGLMFDFEGKLVYGTEFNLCIVDKDFN
jgi:ligand-binding sensor domain-containing protein